MKNATIGLRTGIEFVDCVARLERRTGRLAYSCIFRSCSGVVRSNKCIKFTLRNPSTIKKILFVFVHIEEIRYIALCTVASNPYLIGQGPQS
jgi:hypothetical protein